MRMTQMTVPTTAGTVYETVLGTLFVSIVQ